ncbi:DUF5130 family protein [Actinokineospora auranticolor]|uniref:Uncharacterized protein DUF5130 n=1 Tax=Actinokineospora auranticolor TaxID=155976 RepID=A0A2S6GV01_9PSEU|nr:DUF5130 family protein [Actinokineospora auranticolor]PPK69017.1 uncharacterized protein DUF5130 [Actinokineospora auranticolor]
MVAGELAHRNTADTVLEDPEHGYGAARTASGRISVARQKEVAPPGLPFNTVQLTRLDEALTLASRATGIAFSVYLGDLGNDSRDRAEELHATIPDSADAVLIAVSPGKRRVEIVTGTESSRRLTDRGCNLAVMSMVASFKEGDLIGGLVSALRMLADQAGHAPRR